MRTEKQIGTIGVDSGTVMLVDACYMPGYTEEERLAEPFQAALDDGSMFYRNKNRDSISVFTAYGDGEYPVYAEYDEDGRVISLRVDFDPEPDYDEYDEPAEDDDEIDERLY